MVSGGPRLGQVESRERAGAQTGRKYEYQYERTARAALDLLADAPKYVCMYCDCNGVVARHVVAVVRIFHVA